jgi:hypothetical protein
MPKIKFKYKTSFSCCIFKKFTSYQLSSFTSRRSALQLAYFHQKGEPGRFGALQNSKFCNPLITVVSLITVPASLFSCLLFSSLLFSSLLFSSLLFSSLLFSSLLFSSLLYMPLCRTVRCAVPIFNNIQTTYFSQIAKSILSLTSEYEVMRRQ